MSETQEDVRPVKSSAARLTGPALESHYRFILWLVPAVDRFPRSRKFLLGDRIQSTALDVQLIEATYTRRRSGHLASANLGLEKLRFLFRLAWDLRPRHLPLLPRHRPRDPEAGPAPPAGL